MKLYIIRHGDPDYALDGLTLEGQKEAELLRPTIKAINPDFVYSSPLGRALKTAKIATSTIKKDIIIKDWLQEFWAMTSNPDGNGSDCAWDWLPEVWTKEPLLFSIDTWLSSPLLKGSDISKCYDKLVEGLDGLLKERGYEREGRYYKAVRPNHDSIVFFCHFGIEGVILSHLLNISPFLLWHGFVALPTSVTCLISEERRQGIAYFRMNEFGSEGHLEKADVAPSFSGRFCECFSDKTRHD